MAAKKTPQYYCTECGGEYQKWAGQCPDCKLWNVLTEAPKDHTPSRQGAQGSRGSFATIEEVEARRLQSAERLQTGLKSVDAVLGGGFLPGSLVLLTGHPGIGKSTLTLQMLLGMMDHEKEAQCWYVCGEESPEQVLSRLKRVGKAEKAGDLSRLQMLEGVTGLGLCELLEEQKPEFVVIDSLQTLSYDGGQGAGSLQHIKHNMEALLPVAKQQGITLLLIGQVNKEGGVAGPQTLSHMVDVVLGFGGEDAHDLRVLRAEKNRFGSTDERSHLSMEADGLHEIADLSQLLLATRYHAAGSALTVVREGRHSYLQEVQMLTTQTTHPSPKRSAQGWSVNRLQTLSAILTRHAGMRLGERDIYASVVGGMQVRDAGADLAWAAALMGSVMEKVLPAGAVFCAEIGLAGELRPVPRLSLRLQELEAKRIQTLITSDLAAKSLSSKTVEIRGMKHISELRAWMMEENG